jgi:hypothetical protein
MRIVVALGGNAHIGAIVAGQAGTNVVRQK